MTDRLIPRTNNVAPAPSKRVTGRTVTRFLVPFIVVVVAIALGAAVGPVVVALFTPASHGPVTEPGPTPVTEPLLKEYASTGDHFRVSLPGSPQIDRKSFSDGVDQIPYTVYSTTIEGTPGFRAVNVYDYTVAPIAEGDTSPEQALNDVVENVPGGHLISRGHVTLDGRDAVFGNYTELAGSQMSQLTNCYVEIIEVGPRLYLVSSGGLSRADFDLFAGSFHLTQT